MLDARDEPADTPLQFVEFLDELILGNPIVANPATSIDDLAPAADTELGRRVFSAAPAR